MRDVAALVYSHIQGGVAGLQTEKEIVGDAGTAVPGRAVDDPDWRRQCGEDVEDVARTHMLVVVDRLLVGHCSRYCSPGELDTEPP